MTSNEHPIFTIRSEGPGRLVEAQVAQAGASLQRLRVDGVDLIETFDETTGPTHCQGQVLIPWPNRVRDGIWSSSGVARQLDITEPERGNAIHGLIRGLAHRPVQRTQASITLLTPVGPCPGYPYALDVQTTYWVTAKGLSTWHSITNRGKHAAPVAIGVHPYLKIGQIPTEELRLSVRATSRLVADDRLNPIGTAPVLGTDYDLSAGVIIESLDLDTAYFDLAAEPDGTYVHSLTARDGSCVQIWGDENYRYAQIYITKNFPAPGGPVTAIAVEPMTALPDALNSGTGLHWVGPGEQWTSTWGITYMAPAVAEPTSRSGM